MDELLRMRMTGGGAATTTGSVQYYALNGNNLIDFYPTPGAADTVTMYYLRLPTTLAQPTDVPEIDEPFASKMLEYGACAEAADYKRDPSEQEYRALFQDWVHQFKAHLNRKEGGVAKQIPVYPGRSAVPFNA